MLPPKELFDRSMNRLSEVSGFSSALSMTQTNRITDTPGELASMVHAKMCAHAESLHHLRVSPLFDHSAMVSLARMMIENATMYFYLRENVSEDDWQLRHAVLRLHDTSSRIKFLRAWSSKAGYEDLKQGQLDLKLFIQSNPSFKKLDPVRQKRLLTGEEVFVDGMRSTAARVAHWRSTNFTAVYSYFSAHTHTAPLSFFRMRLHSIDYIDPSAQQYEIAAMATEIATFCLRRVSLHYLGNDPELVCKFPAKNLSELKKEDALESFLTIEK